MSNYFGIANNNNNNFKAGNHKCIFFYKILKYTFNLKKNITFILLYSSKLKWDKNI